MALTTMHRTSKLKISLPQIDNQAGYILDRYEDIPPTILQNEFVIFHDCFPLLLSCSPRRYTISRSVRFTYWKPGLLNVVFPKPRFAELQGFKIPLLGYPLAPGIVMIMFTAFAATEVDISLLNFSRRSSIRGGVITVAVRVCGVFLSPFLSVHLSIAQY